MLDLSNAENKLPSSITVEGVSFPIQTDFRYWLKFAKALEDKDDDFTLFDLFPYQKPKPEQFKGAFEEILKFYNPPSPIPRNTGGGTSEKVLDYFIDADYIYSAFLEVYGIDLLDDKLRMHWHKFNALMKGLHGTKLDDIIGYRCYTKNDTKYEDQMKRLKEAWRLPQKEDAEAEQDLEKFNELFK